MGKQGGQGEGQPQGARATWGEAGFGRVPSAPRRRWRNLGWRALVRGLLLGAALVAVALSTACAPWAADPFGPPRPSQPALPRADLQQDEEAMPDLGVFDSNYGGSGDGLRAPLGSPSAPALGEGALLGE